METAKDDSAIYDRRKLRLRELRISNALLCLTLILMITTGSFIYFYAPSISAFQEEYQARKTIEYLESTKLILEKNWFSNSHRQADIKDLGRLIELLITACEVSNEGPGVAITRGEMIDDPRRVRNIFESLGRTAEEGGEQFHLLVPNGDSSVPIAVPPKAGTERHLDCISLLYAIADTLSALEGLTDDLGHEIFRDLVAGKYKSLDAINENIRFYKQMLALRGDQPDYMKNLQTYTNIRLWTGITTVILITFILSLIRGNVTEQRRIQGIILGLESEPSTEKISDKTISEIIEKLRDRLFK